MKALKANVWSNPLHFIAFGFGSGLLPVMPGTYGTLVAVPIYFLMQDLSLLSYFLIMTLVAVFGVWLSGKVSKDIGIHDYPGMNFDEIVGFLITMFAAPKGWIWIMLGFALFRLFDIWKPGPIAWVDEKVTGGFGVIFDDVLAALCAWLGIQAIAYFTSSSVLLS